MSVIERLNEGEPDIAVSQMKSQYEIGRRAEPDSVLVELDLTCFAADSVIASEHFGELVQALDSEPWCTGVHDGGSEVVPGGISLERVAVSCTRDSAVSVVSARRGYAPSRIRALASDARTQLGDLAIGRPRDLFVSAEVFDRIYRAKPMSRADRLASARVFEFCSLLEEDGLTVTRILLSPTDRGLRPGEPVGSWTWDLDVTQRSRVESAGG